MLLFVLLFFFANTPKANAQTCSNTPTSSNTITTTFTIPETNTYTMWSRIIAADTINNSFWLQIDNGCAINVGDNSSIPTNQFSWINYQNGNTTNPIRINLAAGDHIIKIIEREGGIGIDQLVVTTNMSCVPTGAGDVCPFPTNTPTVIYTPTVNPSPVTNTPTPFPTPTTIPTPTIVLDTTPPAITIISPQNASIVQRGKTVTITANATDNVAIKQVQFSITGKGGNDSCTDSTYPYSCNWLVPSKPSTSYTIKATASDLVNNTSVSTRSVMSSR
jgi:hypothetical protein